MYKRKAEGKTAIQVPGWPRGLVFFNDIIARHEKKGEPVSRGSIPRGTAEQAAAATVLNGLIMNGGESPEETKGGTHLKESV